MEVCGAIMEGESEDDNDEESPEDSGLPSDDQVDQREGSPSNWRQSLGRMWPFGRSQSPDRTETVGCSSYVWHGLGNLYFFQNEVEEPIKEEDEDSGVAQEPLAGASQTPIADIHNNPFMTPQIPKREATGPGRLSLGLPRRVPAQQPWKVNEITVVDAPPATPAASSPARAKRESISEEERKVRPHRFDHPSND
jgi:hypothetical protein